ncbi:hypothetical protein [Helicobacter canis]|nr:hypothetical protein [Helicobacter canis]
MTALNFFNGVNCSPKTGSPTPRIHFSCHCERVWQSIIKSGF